MKPKFKMCPDEIQLLEQVKNFASYDKLAFFFNRSEITIRQNIFKIYRNRAKYIYYKPKINKNNQPFNGKMTA
jgi:hypothetical protein